MEKSCKGICSECDILCSISIQKHNLLLDDVLGKIQTLEKENKLLVEKLEKAKEALYFVDYQFRCSLGSSDDMRESIKLARQTLVEIGE